MAREKKEKKKKPKIINTTFNLFNIKLRLPSGEEASEQEYIKLFTDADTARVRIKVNQSVGVMFRRLIDTEVDSNAVLFGLISRYTPIEGDAWVNFDNPDSDERVAVPHNTAPNRRDTWFYFVPKVHRLALIKKSDSLPLKFALAFLQKGLAAKLAPDHALDIEIANGAGAFDQILAAKQVKTLRIAVTYTNNDANDELAKGMDDQLKDAHIRRLLLEASADETGSILISESELISGALGIAKDNGNVTASIVNDNDQRVTVESKDFPRQETISTEVSETQGSVLQDIVAKIISLFPRQ